MSVVKEDGIAAAENKQKSKKDNIFRKVKNVFSTKDDAEFTAERAWLETTYGEGCNLSLEERIDSKRKEIIELIKSKFPTRTSNMIVSSKHTSYRCVIDLEEDLSQHKDEILNPFIEKGFKIIDLSEKIDEIEDEHVYLISWKNIFKKKWDDLAPKKLIFEAFSVLL